MDIYREEILDHYEHPRNQGEISTTGLGQVLSGRDSNASCGDMVQFYVRVTKASNAREVNLPTRRQILKPRITEVKWKGIGCAITTAAASKLSEYLQGQVLEKIQKMSEEELTQKGVGFEVNPGRIKCLKLSVRLVKKIVDSN